MARPAFVSGIAKLVACGGLLVVPAAVHAEAFFGGSLGRSDFRDAECGATQCDRHDTAGTVRLGYQHLPWLGVEARYVDLGKARFTAPFADTLGGAIVSHSDFAAQGFGVDAVFSWPASERIRLSGIVGVARMEGKARFTFDSPPGSNVQTLGLESTRRSTQPYFGVSAAYAVAPAVWLSLEAERYRVDFGGDDTPVDLLSAGITYRFR